MTRRPPALFLRGRLDWRKSLAILAGFGGVIVSIDPFGTARQANWIGIAACLVCVDSLSVNMVCSRGITQTDKSESIVFFSGIVMAAYGFGSIVGHTQPLTGRLTVALCSTGFFCALGNVCFNVAIKQSSSATVLQYRYPQLLTGALIAYLSWHEIPAISLLPGGVLIVGSGLSIATGVFRQQIDVCPLSPLLPEE
jgi:drug/metabolite transporter (DMT)-like permease